MLTIYRLPDGLYVQDHTDPYMNGEILGEGDDPDEIWLEKVEFIPLEEWILVESANGEWRLRTKLHTWKIEICYLEKYARLKNFGYNDLSQVPQFIASYY